MGAWINFHDKQSKKQLITILTGKLEELSSKTAGKAFWRYPLVTIKAIFFIHWQAVKLFLKEVIYVPKPMQLKHKVTKTHLGNE